MLFCSGRAGTASLSADVQGTDLVPLFEKIVEYIPAPEGDNEGPLQLLVSSIDYNEFVGRIGIGRIERGRIRQNQDVLIKNYHDPDQPPVKTRIVSLYQFEALRRETCESAEMGDIICFSGAENITIGDTICDVQNPEPLPFVKISEPVMEMTFSVNDGPLAGREGKLVTSRQIRSRLYRETLKDVSLRVRDGESADSFLVAGRGEMHLSILIETMRREGYELLVSAPRVLYKTDENGNKTEPAERVTVDVPEDYMGSVMEKLGSRKGTLIDMGLHGNRMRIQYVIPARCLFGYRSEFLTDTRGEGIINSIFEGYIPYQGEISTRFTGSLVASEDGESTSYALYSVQDRGDLFITVGEQVYMGMVIGENPKSGDICVNVCKQKHLTSIRSSGADEKLILTPPRDMGLEKAIEFIGPDELVEVTPKNIRLRKRILDTQTRLKTEARLKK
jgi:GTP-binding protein